LILDKNYQRDLKAATAACLADPPAVSIAEGWRARLIKSDRGKQLPVVANALVALRYAPEWAGVLHFDESSLNTIAKKLPPWDDHRPVPFTWTDEDDIRTAAWLQDNGIMTAKETAGQAVQTVAKDHPFHPVRDHLDALKWDNIKRIDDWLTLYLGADPSDYIRAVAAKWLIGAVARIYQPGCKNDSCLILEGEQGTLKSTALKALADPWFTDDIAELGTKDSALQTRGVWLIELSELDSMARSEVSRIKSFMSRATDRFRPPFGRRPIECPRECFFAGTVNHSNYLRDETGGRRFWPVKCGVIHIKELRRDKGQLWAEAVHRFRAGANWWLDEKHLIQAASDEQQQRYEGDPWDDLIANWVKKPERRTDSFGNPTADMVSTSESVTITDILTHCIGKRPDTWNQWDKNRVGRCLRALGWESYQQRSDGDRERRYRLRPPTGAPLSRVSDGDA
jgi:putative DNA primase/helicase